jgi:hypothetical protein
VYLTALAMSSDRLLELVNIARLQQIINGGSPWLALSSLLLVATVGVLVDYGRMLWLRSKMVSGCHSSGDERNRGLTYCKPPGPLPLPIVGNTFHLPDNKPWLWFEQLSKQYNSPLVTVWIGR